MISRLHFAPVVPALVASALLALAPACGGGGSGGAGGSSAASTGGGSGTSTATGTATGTSTGATGTGGGAPAMPEWETLAVKPAGCAVERLKNPSALQAFTWSACAGTPGCEEAKSTLVFDAEALFDAASESASGEARIGLSALSFSMTGAPDHDVELVTDGSGAVLDGYRFNAAPGGCLSIGLELRGDRVALLLRAPASLGGLIHTVGAAGPPIAFDGPANLDAANTYSGGLGESTWLWRQAQPTNALVAFSLADGKVTGKVGFTANTLVPDSLPVTDGKTFFAGLTSPAAKSALGLWDGKAMSPTTLLEAPMGDGVGSPVVAGSTLAWQTSTAGAFELWASPIGADPTQLNAVKVANLPSDVGMLVGGPGDHVTATLGLDMPVKGAPVWNLVKKERKDYTAPKGLNAGYGVVTSKHLYLNTYEDVTQAPSLARFQLQ